MLIPNRTNKIRVICPICKTSDLIGIPRSRLNKNSNLNTISIHKGLICPHHFQVFIDNNFQVRGYQKVDLELNNENSKNLRNGVKAYNQNEKFNQTAFESLILDDKNVKFIPLNYKDEKKNSNLANQIKQQKKKMTPKEIYEEFWEFIDEDNEIFLEYIMKDNRRQKSSISSNISECITI